MNEKSSKSKIVTVSLRIADVQNNLTFYKLFIENTNPENIREGLLKKYHTNSGILEGFLDNERIVLQWYPKKVDQSAEKLHTEASDLVKKKQYEAAISKYTKAISINSGDVEYVYKLGLIYFELKTYPQAIKYLEHAVQICPIHFRSHLLLGISWIKLRKFDKAEVYVLESNILNRSNVLTYLNLGVIYSIQKRFNEAIQMFNASIQLSPNESRAYLGLARIYSMLSDTTTSNSYFKKVIELSPRTPIAEYARRSIRIPVKEESIVDKSDNNGREEQFAKGIGLFLAGNYTSSADQYKVYLKNHPSDDYAWYLIGEVKIRLGELDKALDCFKRAIRLNHRRSPYYKALAIAFHYLGKSKDAIKVMNKTIEMGKKDSLCYTILGINFLRERKLEAAIKNLQISIRINPNNQLALYNLALALFQTQENVKAIEILEKILTFEFFAPIKNQANKLLKNIRSSNDTGSQSV